MNILRPHGMVERMSERHRKSDLLPRYGREKDGSPQDAQTMKIAHDNDRRDRRRRDDNPMRGRLIDLNT